KATVGAHTKRSRRGSGERELDMTLGGKHACPHAAARRVVGKMSDDRFAVLENVTIAIDDFQRFHKILLWQRRFVSLRLLRTDTAIPGSSSLAQQNSALVGSVGQFLQDLLVFIHRVRWRSSAIGSKNWVFFINPWAFDPAAQPSRE